jgi:hypothetical protein
LQAAKQGWGTDWSKIESPVLAEVLDNPVGRLGRPKEIANPVAR